MDIVDDDKDNGRGGGTTRRMRTMAKEDEDGGQGGVLGSVWEGKEPKVVGCLCGRRVAHFNEDNNNKG